MITVDPEQVPALDFRTLECLPDNGTIVIAPGPQR